MKYKSLKLKESKEGLRPGRESQGAKREMMGVISTSYNADQHYNW